MYICIYNYTVQQYIYIIPYVYIRTVYTRLLENWAGSSFNFNVKIVKNYYCRSRSGGIILKTFKQKFGRKGLEYKENA